MKLVKLFLLNAILGIVVNQILAKNKKTTYKSQLKLQPKTKSLLNMKLKNQKMQFQNIKEKSQNKDIIFNTLKQFSNLKNQNKILNDRKLKNTNKQEFVGYIKKRPQKNLKKSKHFDKIEKTDEIKTPNTNNVQNKIINSLTQTITTLSKLKEQLNKNKNKNKTKQV